MPQQRPTTSPFRRLAEGWNSIRERREHDTAMQSGGIAAGHSVANARARSNGEPGCRYCR
jgi:hypothetical protein